MFGTSGIRGEVGEEVTADVALSVGRALASEGYDRVVVGRDTRESGTMLADALSAGVRECGADVVRLGTAATPTVARSVGWLDADAGVAVTASHNPPADNGLKLWTPSGRAFDGQQRDEIARRVHQGAYALASAGEVGSESEWEGGTGRHVAALREATGSLDGLHAVVDVGNGAGRLTATALDELGCSVTTLHAEPDGSFPGRPSEPTAETCTKLCRLVEHTDAHFGVAHDGDADRTMAVTGEGEFVPGDLLLALFGRACAGAGERVAAPLNTSLAVDDALADVGASVVRTKVGDTYVAERVADDDVAFGGEPSGAWIWPGETRCPDGPLAACRLAELVRDHGPLGAQLDGIGGYVTRRESREAEAKSEVVRRVHREAVATYDTVDVSDGVRVDVDDGWFLVRASGTQPLVRVTAEAEDAGRADELFEAASELVADARAGESSGPEPEAAAVGDRSDD
ncbi:phosphoglucosamine mutase [Halorarum salinum]|uniref:Phosphoglucosamine mutase n=1 Tax=Halorarum salinum TaxID=2743089 RepID=A0A7D5QI63_9EURY|nr:phosphoglucosamine mutase [Halobaculum salinum]QLG60405.1 phosphoglucosamine mutase [Halobaculum salinum]